jgi:hypothetical protein
MRVSDLIRSYQTDAASSYHGNRRLTRQHSDCLCRIIEADLGAKEVADIRTRDITLTYASMTQRYSRNEVAGRSEVQQKRIAGRAV